MYPYFDLEPQRDSKWPRRLTIVGYLVGAVILIVSVIHGIDLPW